MSRKRTNQIVSFIIQTAIAVIVATIVTMIFFAGIKQAYSFGYAVFGSPPAAPAPGTDKLFVVEEGMSTAQCVENLERAGLIRDKNIALIQEFFYEYEVYPGTYTLNTSMTVKEILAELNEEPPQETATQAQASSPSSEDEGQTREIIEGDE